MLLMLLLKNCNKHIPFSCSFILSENSEENKKYCGNILTASDKILSTYSKIQKILSF